MMSPAERSYIFRVLGAGWLLAVFTGLYNVGFLALDDYNNEILGMIPAQTQLPIADWLNQREHPPLARVLLSAVTRGWLAIGIEAPVWQLRLTLALLAAVNFAMSGWVLLELFAKATYRTTWWAALLLGFYFLEPLIISRPMVESLSIPFLLVSVWFATQYHMASKFKDLGIALVVLAAGCMLRFQIGVVVPALFILPLLRRRYAHAALLFGLGLVCIGVTGAVDMILGLPFHGGIRRYIEYNEHASEWHGAMPVYNFLLLFIGLSLPPTFVSRFRGMKWQQEYRPLIVVLLFFIFFVICHSAFPHKEERFMIPMIPFFILLIAPLLAHFTATKAHWRVVYFLTVNALLLALVVTQIPQRNTIDLALAVDSNAGVKSLAQLEDSLGIFPAAYGVHSKTVLVRAVSIADIANNKEWPCSEPLIVRFDKSASFATEKLSEKFIKVREFPPGLVERVLVRTNPGRNIRRGQLEVWWPEKCGTNF
jgi:hypothetical protein